MLPQLPRASIKTQHPALSHALGDKPLPGTDTLCQFPSLEVKLFYGSSFFLSTLYLAIKHFPKFKDHRLKDMSVYSLHFMLDEAQHFVGISLRTMPQHWSLVHSDCEGPGVEVKTEQTIKERL